MKISEIFNIDSTKEAATYSEIKSVDVNNCSCHKNLPNAIPDDLYAEVKARGSRSPEFHQYIANKTLELINNKNTKALYKLVPDLPGEASGTEKEKTRRLVTHLLSHADAAGMKPADLGISDDMYNHFMSNKKSFTKELADQGGRNFLPIKSCSSCEQYEKEFNNEVNNAAYAKLQDSVEGPATPEAAAKSGEEIRMDVIGDWMKGQPYEGIKDPSKKHLYTLLDNWDTHHRTQHKTGISAGAYNPRTPIEIADPDDKPLLTEKWAPGEEPRNKDVDAISKKLIARSTDSGFVRKPIPNLPKYDPLVDENNKPIIEPRRQGEDGWETETEYKKRAQSDIDDILEAGNVDIEPGETSTGNQTKTVRLPKLTAESVTPWHGLYTNYSIQRHPEPTVEQYDITQDKRPFQTIRSVKDIDASEPEITRRSLRTGFIGSKLLSTDASGNEIQVPRFSRRDRWMFQESGVEPNVAGLRQYSKKMRSYEDQGKLGWMASDCTHAPGEERTMGVNSVADTYYSPNGKICTEHSAHFVDRDGDVWARRMPGDNKPIKKPSAASLTKARKDYYGSLSQAFRTLNPSVYDGTFKGKPAFQTIQQQKKLIDTAYAAIDDDHKKARIDAIKYHYTSPKNRYRASSKEETMEKFVFNSAKQQKVCEKCGKFCANVEECKSNVDQRRREQAAEAAFND